MARPLRLEYAGAFYHVTARGDRREQTYDDDEDRSRWLEILSKVCDRCNWRIHAYCLMDNHYHVVIETPGANLSKGMRQLYGGLYAILQSSAQSSWTCFFRVDINRSSLTKRVIYSNFADMSF
jgi:REP element-mobilizing transposase RayT